MRKFYIFDVGKFKRETRYIMVPIAVSVFLIGCSAQDIAPYVNIVTDQNNESGQVDPSANSILSVDSAAESRLLVLGIDGNILTMSPTGDDIISLTDDASAGKVVYQQPTWSPNGKLIAWTQTVTNRGNTKAQLQIGDHLGQGRSELDLPFAPFYYYWSPDSERLAYLSNWVYRNMGALALRIVEVSTEGISSKTLAIGQPSYFSWAPNGRQMITHIGNEITSIRSIDGENKPLSEASSGFSAPQWVADGESIIYAVDQGNQRALIVSDKNGDQLEEVTTFDNKIMFAASSTARYFAYTTEDPASLQNSASGLYVVDIDSMQTQEVSSAPSLGFIWSPDGEKLAFMQVEIVEGKTQVRWYVWRAEDGSVQAYDLFIPSRTFLQVYLPFFDQYVQSMTMWAPDSAAFVYAANGSEGGSSIWVQQLADEKAMEIGDGVFATWSPQ